MKRSESWEEKEAKKRMEEAEIYKLVELLKEIMYARTSKPERESKYSWEEKREREEISMLVELLEEVKHSLKPIPDRSSKYEDKEVMSMMIKLLEVLSSTRKTRSDRKSKIEDVVLELIEEISRSSFRMQRRGERKEEKGEVSLLIELLKELNHSCKPKSEHESKTIWEETNVKKEELYEPMQANKYSMMPMHGSKYIWEEKEIRKTKEKTDKDEVSKLVELLDELKFKPQREVKPIWE